MKAEHLLGFFVTYCQTEFISTSHLFEIQTRVQDDF